MLAGARHWSKDDGKVPPIPIGVEDRFDWDALLSMDLVRQHTKTDDVPGVTDEQMRLYRAAAIEAAELYTGLLLSCTRSVTEPIHHLHNPIRHIRRTYKHRLRWPTADGILHLYGASHPQENGIIHVEPGRRTIQIPIRTGFVDVSNCCDPCSRGHMLNDGMMAVYRAGFSRPEAVPAGVKLGILQFIAWTVEHPGDELLTQRGKIDARSGDGSYGSNNIALVSGALETWRQYDNDGI